MATIISSNTVNEHNVDKYSFKVIALGQNEGQKREEKAFTADNNPKARVSDVDSSALSMSAKESLIESLMKKMDEMSSNFIKLQMKSEAKEEEFEQELKKAKKEAFNKGLKAGEAKEVSDELMKELQSASKITLKVNPKDLRE